MVKLANVLSRLNPAEILVIGDLLLDTYTIGTARRISPEAPVAIVQVHHEEHRPGGAGNVVLNLLSLGAQVKILSRIGEDWGGNILREAFKAEGVNPDALFIQDHYSTPIKNRVIADHQQIVRVDHEQLTPLTQELEQKILNQLPFLLENIKTIAISDYGKGFLTPLLLKEVIRLAKERQIPVVTDPKGHNFSKYEGTTVIKPNVSEAYLAAHLPVSAPLEEVAAHLLQVTQAHWLMITRSEAGIALFEANGKRHDFPVTVKEVKDVTGAGDTVLAILTYAVANQLSYTESAQLCNVAAGIAIEHVGCARVTLSDLAHRLLEQHIRYKVFDQEHLFVLQEVLKCQPYHLLILSGVEGFTRPLFQALKQLAGQNIPLLVYMSHQETNELLLELLTSLSEVNFIVTHIESLQLLCQTTQPLQAYCFDSLNMGVQPIDLFTYLPQTQIFEEVSMR